MDELIDLLHQGGYSCVIGKQGEIRTFHQRGVADLWALCQSEERLLHEVQIADKVVGKGAAALMVYGGVREVYAEVISKPALALLQEHGVPTTYHIVTDNIINRKGDGICPVETLCTQLHSIEDMYNEIGKFINRKA